MRAKALHALAAGLGGLLLASPAAAEFDIQGDVRFELRGFPGEPAFADQDDVYVAPSVALAPEFSYEFQDFDGRLILKPFLRLDRYDDRRTHFDLREAHYLHQGWDWDLLVGFTRVFWGVTESRHLVDVINQFDTVEDVDLEDKLGQPMINLALLRDWGTINAFVMPGFRERTFASADARLGGALPIEVEDPVYESDLGQAHVDVALRYEHTIGDFDFGIAHFRGTGREPRLETRTSGAAGPRLVPHYDIIDQTSLDAQATKGAWLLKLEALTRSGQGDRFAAVSTGFEYTFYGVIDGRADLGVIGEHHYDGRGDDAPGTTFDHDGFAGLRLALNDVDDTEILMGAIIDYEDGETLASVEAERRLGERWLVELEARMFMDVESTSVLSGIRRDDFVTLRFTRFF